MSNPTTNSAVAVFHTHQKAEEAIRELQKSGFDIKKLSIIGKDYHTEEHVVGYYNTGDRMKSWGANGAFWGALWGMLFGSAFFAIPGLGPVLVAGPLVGLIIASLEGAAVVGGIGVLGGALASIGVPENSVVNYIAEIKTGKFLLIVHGTGDEVERAKQMIEKSPTTKMSVYSKPVATSA
jgi:uncharacterized membrane protein